MDAFSDRLRARLRQFGRYLQDLLTNKYFWAGLGTLLLLGSGFYIAFNNLLMPTYTRHGTSITVPEVTNRSYEEAARILREHDLRVEQAAQRYNPELPRDVVADQSPPPQASVKPGRRVYLTVNSGETPMVRIPSVEGASVREARNRITALGLEVSDLRADTIPSPYQQTITRQEPAPGDSLARGEGVTLWYSTGLGQEYVSVPEVTNLTVEEAQQMLMEHKLRSVIVATGEEEERVEATEEEISELVVVRQSRSPGTRMREGSEIRLFVEPEGQDED